MQNNLYNGAYFIQLVKVVLGFIDVKSVIVSGKAMVPEIIKNWSFIKF